MKTPPGTNTVSASQLQIGDITLNDDGSYYSTIYDVFTDDYGTWVEDDFSMGYVDKNSRYTIETE